MARGIVKAYDDEGERQTIPSCADVVARGPTDTANCLQGGLK